MELLQLSVKDYIALTASDEPAPGGGSASALCGAQGAALCTMVAKLTLAKEKLAPHHPACTKAMQTTQRLEQELLGQVELDTQAYSKISQAFKLPKETEGEKAARKQAIAQATLYATQVPLHTMELAAQGLACLNELQGQFNPNCASDLGCAALEFLACVKGAWMNVVINMGGIADEQTATELQARGEALLTQAQAMHDALYDEILTMCRG